MYHITQNLGRRWNILMGTWSQHSAFSTCMIPYFPNSPFSCDFGLYRAVWAIVQSLYFNCQNIFSVLCGTPFGKAPAALFSLTSPHLEFPLMLLLPPMSNGIPSCNRWLPKNTRWWFKPAILVCSDPHRAEGGGKEPDSWGTCGQQRHHIYLLYPKLLWFGGWVSWLRNTLLMRDFQMWQ